MRVLVDTGKQTQYKLGATGIDDIVQCVNILLTTYKKTVFLDRDLGINADIIDEPTNRSAKLYQEIFRAIEENEPRAEVIEIKTYLADIDGKVEIKLILDVKDEYLRR